MSLTARGYFPLLRKESAASPDAVLVGDAERVDRRSITRYSRSPLATGASETGEKINRRGQSQSKGRILVPICMRGYELLAREDSLFIGARIARGYLAGKGDRVENSL